MDSTTAFALMRKIKPFYNKRLTVKQAHEQLKCEKEFEIIPLSTYERIYSSLRDDAIKQSNKKNRRLLLRRRLGLKIAKTAFDSAEKRLYFNTPILCDHQHLKKCIRSYAGHVFNKRFLFTLTKTIKVENEAIHRVQVFDLYNNVSNFFSFPKAGKMDSVVILNDDSILTIEVQKPPEESEVFIISLMSIDWINKKFDKLDSFVHTNDLSKVVVNKIDTSQFVLYWARRPTAFFKLVKIENNRMSVGQVIQTQEFIYIYSYFNDYVYSFVNFYRMSENMKLNYYVKLCIYDTKDKNFVLKTPLPLPKGSCINQTPHSIAGVRDRLYVVVCFENSPAVGVAWIDPDSCVWSFVDFATRLPNIRLECNENDLLIEVNDGRIASANDQGSHYCRALFYSIPMNNPDSLSNLCWFTLVRHLANPIDNTDPFEKARQYRPCTSDIYCRFSDDE